MLCPEVWNFKAPDSTFSAQKTDANENQPPKTINSLIYNHLVSVVLPDTFRVPDSLTEALIADCDYYKVSDLAVSDLVSKEFLTSFVNSGSLYLLSINTRIDCDNCVAVTPTGQLVLNLDKATYQSLGLEGTVSHFHAKTKERYVVTVDLKLGHFKPGKPNYERTKKCLSSLDKFTVIVSWVPPDEEICPSSIAKYFHDLGYDTKLCVPKHKVHTVYSVETPLLDDSTDHFDFVEWLGMVSLQADLDGGPESYLSTYETPEPNTQVGQVKVLQWKGFFTVEQIRKFYNQLKTFTRSAGCLWASLYVQGFSDSPISWSQEREHHYYQNGDNGYVIVLKGDSCLICCQKCSRKRYRNKIK